MPIWKRELTIFYLLKYTQSSCLNTYWIEEKNNLLSDVYMWKRKIERAIYWFTISIVDINSTPDQNWPSIYLTCWSLSSKYTTTKKMISSVLYTCENKIFSFKRILCISFVDKHVIYYLYCNLRLVHSQWLLILIMSEYTNNFDLLRLL